MEQQTCSKLGRENKVVYCHPAYLTYIQSTLCEMPSWVNHKMESRFPGEISTTPDMQVIELKMEKCEEKLKRPLMRVKE